MPNLTPPHLKLLVIRTTDLDCVAQWYRLLGIEFAQEQHGSGPMHFAAEIGGMVFEIYPARRAGNVDRTTRLGFSVPDLQATIASLQGLEGAIVQLPQESPWGLRAVVRDPDGRTVELCEHEPAK